MDSIGVLGMSRPEDDFSPSEHNVPANLLLKCLDVDPYFRVQTLDVIRVTKKF